MSTIDKARGDSRIKTILSEVTRKVKVKYRNSGGEEWFSNLKNGTATIGYCGCRNPSAALAHELLHIDTQLRGYRRMRIFVSSIAEPPSFKRLMDCLDNELQHHKFYTKFLDMGFDPEQFYADSDNDTGNYLTQAVRQPYRNLIDVLPDFMTVIAPGGSLDHQARMRSREEFLALNDSTYSQQLERVEEILKEWTAAGSYDAIDTVKNLMLCIQPTDNLTWIGFNTSDRPPDTGFFVDQSFVTDETAP